MSLHFGDGIEIIELISTVVLQCNAFSFSFFQNNSVVILEFASV